jgi:MYXO-CTERM domain-containing protein
MKTRSWLTACAAAIAASSSPGQAEINTIQPFYGEAFESFELHNLGFYNTVPSAYPVFDGKAAFTNSPANQVGVANVVSDTRGYEVTAHNGNHFAGTPIGALTITFDLPVGAFGTWISNAGFFVGDPTATNAPGVAEFYDANGFSLGTQPLDVTVEVWKWHGWTSTDPIKSIEFRVGNVPPGAPYESVLVDAMVFDTSSTPSVIMPEPATALMLLAGFAGVRRRRA